MTSSHHPCTSALLTAICFMLVLAFVPDAHAVDYDWSGNGDDSSGGNWSDEANWDSGDGTPGNDGYPDDAGDTADMQAALSSPRYITNDVAVTVGTIVMEDDTDHHLVLGADLYTDVVDGPHNKYDSTIHVNGYTFTVGQSIGPGGYMPKIDGPGTMVKVSANAVTLQGADTFTGTIIVSNGMLNFRSSLWDTTTLMTVEDGGTADLIGSAANFPTNTVINGDGYNSGGALQFSTTENCSSDITLGSDSKIKAAGGTTTLSGDIIGTDVLMLEGGSGDFQIASASAAFSGKLIITNTTVLMQGNMPNVTNIWVDAGGVLEGLQSQFPSAVVIETNGGVWNLPNSAEWTGNGDGSNWTDTANWAPPVVPTNVATIPYPASSRTIYLDAATNLAQLALAEGANNKLELQADLTVNLVDHPLDDGYPGSIIRLNGYTFSANSGSGTYFPALGGDGTFVKYGTGQVTLQSEDTFTGAMIASNGVLYFRAQDWDTTTLLTVIDGATAYLAEPGPSFPTNIIINGQGYSSAGALDIGGSADSCSSDITVATDSKIRRSGTATTTFTGDFTGPGDLTFQSASANFDLDGTYNFAINGADANKIITDSGDVNISGATLSVSGEAGSTEDEYVIIDYSGSGTVTGEFGDTNDLAGGWSVDYDGTVTYADSVVLVSVPTYPPDIETTAPTNIAETSANLNGTLDDSGGAPADVYVFYGKTDGTTNKTGANAWDTSVLVAAAAPLGVVTYAAGSLNDDEVYFYRYYASNTTYDAWATNSQALLPDEVTITKTADAVEENTVPGTFTLHRAASATNGAITVNFTVSGNATAGVHYVDNLGTSLTLEEGQSNAVIVVTPITNLTTTYDTTVTVSIATGLYLAGTPGSADLTITNYEPPEPGTNFTWSGNGDANNGGNWNNQLNWDNGDGTPGNDGYPDSAEDDAALTPNPGSVRYITNNVATTIGTLTMAATANSRLVLDADLTVDTIAGDHDTYKSPIDLNGNTLTVGQNSSIYMAQLKGSGTFVKVSTGSVQLQGEDNYTGSIIVSNGTLKFRSPAWDVVSLMTVIDGATAWQNSTGGDMPTNIVINGQGYDGGALKFSVTDDCVSDITVASDSKIKQSSGTTTLSGQISGTDVLTLEGGSGDFQIAGSGSAFSGKLVITNTSVLMQGSMPNVTNIWVDAGGVLEGLQSQFASAVVIETNGGVWLTPSSAEWTGNGDGSNWTDTANWAPQVVPTNVATIPYPASSRTIVVDAPTNVYQLAMAEGANNVLLLQADFTVDLVDHVSDDGYPSAKIRLNGNTLTVRSGSATYFPALNDDGGGSLVKNGTETVRVISEDNFTGSMVVNNGVLYFYGGDWDVSSGLTVEDGATAYLSETGPELPPDVTINGQGYSDAGALDIGGNADDCSSDFTVATDSTIRRSGTATTTFTGNFTGPGDLTLESASANFDLDGTYNFEISGAAGNKIIADSGDVNISGATLTVSGEGTATESEYVVIDFSGSGTVTGTFAIENLSPGWQVDYDGTDANPDCVVVELPPPGLQLIFK